MNYTEIVALAISYSDRTDATTASEVDGFLRVVESRVNKKLKTQKMGSRSSLPIVNDQRIYDLPSDFAGLRDIKILDGAREKTVQLATPEFISGLADNPSFVQQDPQFGTSFYSIVADKLEIFPPQKDTGTIDIVYYKRVPELTSGAANNWLSDDNPECYVFGLVVEISAYAKDAEAVAAWDMRFKESMNDIHIDDQTTRWGGPSMAVRIV